ncbi:FAR1-related sequence 5-like protein [Tanacetum coccineum]|uniref:FAR1-related sequence 5-like protein n=1 Tax=Tanacetum coccineum TaxID=301880 RepID=A0ABQ4Z8K0_9ASTR
MAATCYTQDIYVIFKKEWKTSFDCGHEISSIDGVKVIYRVGFLKGNKKNWKIVEYNVTSDIYVTCSCARFETSGILCKHILYIMRRESLTTIPNHYIIPRWTMKATYKVGVLNGLLEEQSKRKKTNIDDDIRSTQQENISQQRPSKKKKNMPQHLLVSDLVVSMKTKGLPKRAIRVKPGLEVSLDLKKKNVVVIVEQKEDEEKKERLNEVHNKTLQSESNIQEALVDPLVTGVMDQIEVFSYHFMISPSTRFILVSSLFTQEVENDCNNADEYASYLFKKSYVLSDLFAVAGLGRAGVVPAGLSFSTGRISDIWCSCRIRVTWCCFVMEEMTIDINNCVVLEYCYMWFEFYDAKLGQKWNDVLYMPDRYAYGRASNDVVDEELEAVPGVDAAVKTAGFLNDALWRDERRL